MSNEARSPPCRSGHRFQGRIEYARRLLDRGEMTNPKCARTTPTVLSMVFRHPDNWQGVATIGALLIKIVRPA